MSSPSSSAFLIILMVDVVTTMISRIRVFNCFASILIWHSAVETVTYAEINRISDG